MINTIKIVVTCALLNFSLSAMKNDNLDHLLKEHLDIARSHKNCSMLIFLNALKRAHEENRYIEICELNQDFLSLATTLPHPLQKLADEKFNTTSLYR